MATVIWTFLLALSGLLFTSADTADCTYYAAIGKSYEVPLDVNLKQGQRQIWKINATTVYDSKRGDAYTHKVTTKGELILPKVTSADTGTYTWEILVDGSKQNTRTVFLCVQEAVSKPTVAFICDEKQNKVQFTCSVPQKEQIGDITFSWFNGGTIVTNEKANILLRTPKQLGSNSFHCTVSNHVSSESSNTVQQDCLKTYEEDSLLLGLDFWLMVGILAGGGGLVLVLVVATIVCCSTTRRKRRLQVKDEQELRLQWSTESNQQIHNHQYVNQRGPAHPYGHSPRPTTGQAPGPSRDSAGHTGPRPPRARQNRPRPPDPITGQPLPGPRRTADSGQTQFNEEENPPPLPQPRKKAPRRTQNQ